MQVYYVPHIYSEGSNSLSVLIIVYVMFSLLHEHCSGMREDAAAYLLPQSSNLGKFIGELTIYNEISKFLSEAREKLGTDCVKMKMCGYTDADHPCIPIYTVFYEEESNITEDMMRTLKEAYRRQCGAYIIVLQSSSAVVSLLHQGDDYRLMNIRARFLIWYGVSDKTFESDDIWKKVPHAILFHTKLGYRARKRMTFTIKGFKWPVLSGVPDPTKVIDFWSQGKYFGRSHESWYKDRTNDLKNATLRILAVEHPPGVIKYETPDGKIEYAGSEVEIVKELSHIMNFQYEFLEVESETKWGGQVSTNLTPHFYGAVARLIYGEADLAIGSFFVLKHYLDFLDMSIPLDVACTSFLTPNPLTRPRYLALILPFNYKLWILVLSICFIFAPFGLHILSKLSVHRAEYHIFKGRSQVVFTCFSIMSQVALHLWPKFWAIRMFIGWFWMFCLLITLAYRGAMVSFLTIPLFENPIDNINDLVTSGLKIGGWGTELHRLFKQYTSTNGHFEIKSVLRDRYEMIDDVNSAISWVAEGEFALYEKIRFLKFVKQTRNLTRLGSPSMRIMKQCIVPVHIGIAYQKNSPIVPTINRHIRRFQESGLIKRWSQRLVTRTKQHYQTLADENVEGFEDNSHHESDNNDGNDEEESEDEFIGGSSSNKQRKQRVLNMRDLQGSIYLICLGFFLSVLSFIVELFVANSKNAAHNVNQEIKKIKEKVIEKGLLVGETAQKVGINTGYNFKAIENLFSFNNTKKESVGKEANKLNMFANKDQFLANMMMEYESILRRCESQKEEKPRRKLTLNLKKPKSDSVRVRMDDNREVFFTYVQ